MSQNNKSHKGKIETPRSGFAGLLQNWKSDALSGFFVSLIALPLSLGIAAASGFPPVMGILTAIIGGLIVSFFSGSALTIKGPAAGLIVVVAAVEELGKGNAEQGWQFALAAVAVSGVIQIVLGLLRVAVLADFFPLSAVHGMLAAIGIIIMSKQIHFVLGADPERLKGKEPLELLGMLPESLSLMSEPVALIGLLSLLMLFLWPLIKNKIIRNLPAALAVLITGIALGFAFGLDHPQYESIQPLVHPGTFQLHFSADFSVLSGTQAGVFAKYVLLFTLIGSLESLLTGKAIDLLDPYKRKAQLSKDLSAVGIGNTIAGCFGGVPMISEVARSSANISNGGKTKWANFFHGVFLLVFVVLLVPVIERIPMATLAAMLIFVGYRLASPKTFFHAYKTGKEQLLVFVVTLVFTLCTDLLAGVVTGIVLELAINLYNGLSLKNAIRPDLDIEKENEKYIVHIRGAGTFSNWIPLSKKINSIPSGKHVVIDVSNARFLDHTFMENIHHFKDEYEADYSAKVEIQGINGMKMFSNDETCARKRRKSRIEY